MPTSRKRKVSKSKSNARFNRAVATSLQRIVATLNEHAEAINTHAAALNQLRDFLKPLVLAHLDLYPEGAIPTANAVVDGEVISPEDAARLDTITEVVANAEAALEQEADAILDTAVQSTNNDHEADGA
jgi:hypothetical protein